MEKKFYEVMNGLTTSAIIEAMRKTWNQPEGEIFREYGFEIIEDREGEEYADSVYNKLYKELAA